MEELRDIRWVARLLGLSERSVYQMVRDGRLPALRVGGRWRFRPAEIEGWLDSVDTRAAPADLIDGGSTRGESGSGEADIAGGRSPEVSLAHVERREFERIVGGIEDTLERRLAFVALLGTASTARGWLPPVVVGGHAVEFYTAGGYATVDIELVSGHEPLEAVLPKWGFVARGRHWVHE